jgi:hypothetical protein
MMQIQLELPPDLAWALAEFLKRVGYGDYRPLAASEQEARDMQDAGEKLRAALAEKGIAPR